MARHVQLYVFRHGETDWNAQKIIQGHTDIELNAVGRAQAAELAERAAAFGIEAVLTSDLQRARVTGETVATRLGVPLVVDARLREIGLGEVEGLPLDVGRARFGGEIWERWKSVAPADMDVKFPGGETKREALARLQTAVAAFAAAHAYTRIGVSTHGGVIRCLAHAAMTEERSPVKIHNCGVHLVELTLAAPHGWVYHGEA